MRALIIPGNRGHFHRIAHLTTRGVIGVLIHEEVPESDATIRELDQLTPARVFTLATLQQPVANVALSDAGAIMYERCLWEVLSDPRSQFLASRATVNSAQNNVVDIETAIANSVRVLHELAPTCLICSSTPHSLPAWVLAKCSEVMGIAVYVFEQSPVRDRAWVLSGLDTQRVVQFAEDDPTALPSEAVLSLLRPQMEATSGTRDAQGVPVSRMELGTIAGAKGNEWWSIRRELNLAFEGGISRLPLRLIQSTFKRRLYRRYCTRASSRLPEVPFIAFFLHYQPERTTLPEGLAFTQQLLALRVLSLGLPKEWRIVVREHPTTWLKPVNPLVRRLDYYDRIAALGKIDLCSMEVDTFDLIDRSEAVATLTGKVGFQGILRGKPAIVLGTAGYKDHPACFSVGSVSDVREAAKQIQSGEVRANLSQQSLMRYLAWVERNSIRAIYEGSDIYELRIRNFEELYNLLLHGPLAKGKHASAAC